MTLSITPLPTPPSRAVPATFSALADAFLGQLPTFATEANALAVEINALAAAAGYPDPAALYTAVAGGVHAATAKASPVSGDELMLVDSAASYGLKKISWSDLKARAAAAGDISSTNLNDAVVNGTYFGASVTNAVTTGWYTFVVSGNGVNYVSQTAHSWTDNTEWKRTNTAGTWGAWSRVLSDIGEVTTANSSSSMGYAEGAGGTVTQATSKGTSVTLNKPCGRITTHNAALGAGAAATFILNNSLVTVSDVLIAVISNSGNYKIEVLYVNGGTPQLRLTNTTGGSLSEAVNINFVVIKGSGV